MKCNQSRPGFELVSPCSFPTTITITPRAPPQTPRAPPQHHGHLHNSYMKSLAYTLMATRLLYSLESSTLRGWGSIYIYIYVCVCVCVCVCVIGKDITIYNLAIKNLFHLASQTSSDSYHTMKKKVIKYFSMDSYSSSLLM